MDIAVWSQPLSSFAKWKSRGINTLIRYEGNSGESTLDAYKAAALASNFKLVLQSEVARPVDFSDPNVSAILLSPDEPDGAGHATPGQVLDAYVSLKEAMAKAGASKPIILNLDGNQLPWHSTISYGAYADASDELSVDYYPINFGQGPESIPLHTTKIKELKDVSGGKPVWSCLECCDGRLRVQPWTQVTTWGPPIGLKMRGPTPNEVWEEAWTMRESGVRGIIWFPHVIGLRWESFDGVTPDVEAAMIGINRMLARV